MPATVLGLAFIPFLGFAAGAMAWVIPSVAEASTPPYNKVRPSISGNVAVGQTLTASTGTWNGNPAPGYSYQWQQCTPQVGVSSTFASLTGSTNSFPEYLRLDPSDNVFSGNRDTANISKLTPAGVPVDSAGATVNSPFTWALAQSQPFGMALDSDGNVFTANRLNNTVTKADIRGTTTTLTSAANATNVAVDSRGYVYAASLDGDSVSRFDPGATTPAQTFTSAGGVNFNEPFGMAFDSSDNLYLFDRGNSRVVKITPGGTTSVFGQTGTSGDRLGIAVDAGGNVYTANGTSPGEIRKLLPDGTQAGGNWPVSIADPWDVAIGPDGNIYVSRGRPGVAGDVFRITPAGIATDVGKTGNWPLGISFDAAGNIYAADRDSSTITKITTMTCSDISGATESSYTLQAGDAGKQLRVRVGATNGTSPNAVAYSAITTGPKNTAVPEISGTTAVGQNLTTSKGSWSAAPPIPDPAGYSYQWQRCESTAVAGDTWVSQTTAANNDWYGMDWGGPAGQEKFVAVAAAGTNAEPTKRVMTSPDGVTWTSRDTPNAPFLSVVWGGSAGQAKFVAVGGNTVMTSPDGVTWTAIPSPSSVVTSHTWRSVTWGGPAGQEKFVAVALSGAVMTSPDGITWTEQTSAVNNGWFGVTWGDPPGATPGQFVAVADSGSGNRVMTSPDGVTWTARTTNNNYWAAVTFGGPLGEEKFVAVAWGGDGNRVMTSPDGVTWTIRSTPVDSNFDAVVWGGIPGQERFVAVADFAPAGTPNRLVMTSPDGNSWTARDAPSNNQWRGVEWGGPTGNERFVAVANSGTGNRAMTSSGPDCADISGATSQTYIAQPADYQKYVRSRVTADNGVDPDGVAFSSISSQIAGQAPTNSGGDDAPTITGTAKVGETLTANSPGTWSGTPNTFTYAYQWQRCDSAGSGCSNISGATNTTYTAQADDYDEYLRVEVTADNGVDPDGVAYSDLSSRVAGIAPTNSGGANAPTISGTAKVGQTLTTSKGTWTATPAVPDPAGYSYQWQVSATGTGDWTSATGTGATTLDYTIAPADYDKYLRVEVTASNGVSPDGVAYSTPTSQVAGIPPTNDTAPSISGTPEVRETLTATSPGTWTGTPNTFSYTYQWQRCDTDSGSCTGITGTNSSTYVIQPADVGKYMRVQVTADNGVSPNGVAYSPDPFSGPVVAAPPQTLYVNKYSPNQSSTPGCEDPDFTEIGSADPSFGAVGAAVSGDTIFICGSPTAGTDPFTSTTGPYVPNAVLGTKSLTFVGDGPERTILDGQNDRTQFYANLYDAGQPTSYLNLRAMTVKRGRDINSGGAVEAGCRDMEVTNVNFIDNKDIGFGEGGGAIHASNSADCPNLADVNVTSSLFTGNVADRLIDYGQGGSDGGAILAYGTVTVTDSRFENNQAGATAASPRAPRGGAISARQGITVTDSRFSSNTATGPGAFGGAIESGGGASISRSSFLSNNATGTGASAGAVYVFGGPAASTISASTFSGNSATGTATQAGALRGEAAALSVTNSTFTGNSASAHPALSSSDDVTLQSVTSSGNSGTAPNYVIRSGGTLSIGNSIIDETGETCVAVTRNNLGGNVIADTTANTGDCLPFVGGGGAPATRVAPLAIELQPLAENGGPTETMALELTSVASTSAGTNLLGANPKDQRGFSRPLTNQSSGAYQLTGPENTAVPQIAGDTVAGETLTTSNGSWTVSPPITGYSYEWQRCEVSANPTYVSGWGGSGSGNGQFDRPEWIATDQSGNVFVADTANSRIQKFDASGTYLGKWGSAGSGPGQFQDIGGVAVGPGGDVFVADTGNNRVQTFSNQGAFIRQWGSPGTGDGQFNSPGSVATDSSGNVYVTDYNNARVQKFANDGTYLTKWGAGGSGVGEFNGPDGIAVDPSGNVYVIDIWNYRVQKFTGTGTYLAQWGSQGSGNGQFTAPSGIAVDSSGNVYVADRNTSRIQAFSPTGTFLFKWGVGGGDPGEMDDPGGLAFGAGGDLYEADVYNARIQRFQALTCSGISGATSNTYPQTRNDMGKTIRVRVTATNGVDPAGTAFSFPTTPVLGAPENSSPPTISGTAAVDQTLTVDDDGTWTSNPAVATYTYQWQRCNSADSDCSNIADATNSTYTAQADDYDKYLRIKVTASNGVSPAGVAFSPSSNQVAGIAPVNDSAPTISGTARVGQTLSTSNGTWSGFPAPTFTYQWQRCEPVPADTPPDLITDWGSFGTGNGQFSLPMGVAIDSAGNVYVADSQNNRIQKFDAIGNFIATWGTAGTGNGQFVVPSAIATDSARNVYVADTGNQRIQKFTSTGAYLGQWGSRGTGNGQFEDPYGVAADNSGNVYVADSANNRVQKFSSAGAYLSQWGGFGSGDGQLNDPTGIATDRSGNVYVADTLNNRIQKFTSSGTYLAQWGSNGTGDGQFRSPFGIATDPAGDVYVADGDNNRIQKFTSSGTYLTQWGTPGSGSGQFNLPTSVATNAAGDVYVTDTNNQRVLGFDLFNCTSDAGAVNQTYALTGADLGKYIRVYVTATNPDGSQTVFSNLTAQVQAQPVTHELSVTRSGTGTGTVTSSPAGIDCGSDCTASYDQGTTVTLAAAPASGSSFSGWSGAGCSGTGSCAVTMGQAQSVTATFTADSPAPPPPPPPPPPTPSGKPKLVIQFEGPKKIKAGQRFRLEMTVSNRAGQAGTASRAGRSADPTTAKDIVACIKLPKGAMLVGNRGKARLEGRQVCRTQATLAAGRSFTHGFWARTVRSASGPITFLANASGTNAEGATSTASSRDRVKVAPVREPKPKPPTG